MKHLYLLLLSTFFMLPLHSQTTTAYHYDNAGNRISRVYVVKMNNQAKNQPQEVAGIEAPIGERKITTYPNPVKELLTIDFGAIELPVPATLSLYDASGALKQNTSVQDMKTQIDLSGYAPGWYLLKISLEENLVIFKIIKE